MAGHTLILNLLGGVALLIWATQMVRKGVMDAFGARLRQAIGRGDVGADARLCRRASASPPRCRVRRRPAFSSSPSPSAA